MKVHHFLFSAICILLMAISCEKEPEVIKVESLSLNSTSLTLVEGETQSLTATVSPSTATNKKVIWSSSNSSVATVDDRGHITAVAAGTTTITAKTDDGGKTATCSVTVNSKVISVESVSLDKTSVELTEGETITLTATVKPDNATNKKVIWSSSNEEIATVKDGVVSAIKEGEATITAKSDDGGKTATCSVKVNAKTIAVESISLDKTEASLKVGETITLTATISPDDATDKNITWSSSDETITTVEDGVVTAITVGKTSIIARCGEKEAICLITVNPKEYEYVDLGLSVKWATCNIGANSPEEYGDYFAWGETETKTSYGKENYKFYKAKYIEAYVDENGFSHPRQLEYDGFTKYVPTQGYGYEGYLDDKTELDPEDDVAHITMGGKWRMPTIDECYELKNNCTREYVELNNIRGYKFTSKIEGYTDKWIFLPFAGSYGYDVGGEPLYWSSSIDSGGPSVARLLPTHDYQVPTWDRWKGLTVRPVLE